MRRRNKQAILATFLIASICASARGQATIYSWIATDNVANWNVPANWNSDFGNEIPDADSFAGDTALINNGRTSLADVKVPRVAGLSVQNGTVDIASGGTVETVADDLASGALTVGGTGVVELSGDGILIVAGDATSSGSVRLAGSGVTMSVGGDFTTTGTLAAGIFGDEHSAIRVVGAAHLAGSLEVEVRGTTPTFGQSWDLVKAASISGRFGSVNAIGSASLPRGLQYQVNTDGETASLQIGNALVASIDRQTGAAMIENVVGAPVEITSYALRSNNGLLAANWQGVLGDGWTTANPTAAHLAELSLSDTLKLDVGASIQLGDAYAGGATKPDDEDLFFEYATGDGNLRSGIVEYTGALNDIVLHVDPTDGSAAIANLSSFIEPVDVTSYAVLSDSGGLTVGTWNSFMDSGLGGDGWTVANPTSNHIAEVNLDSSKLLSNGTVLSLGKILASDAELDLLFQYTTTGGELLQGTVQYGAIPTAGGLPGDCNNDGTLDALDLTCVGDIAERDAVLAALAALPGDLNGDGSVAFEDFLILSANFGEAGVGYAGGDIDLGGDVAFTDFLVLSGNFGDTPAVAASVPEPTTSAFFSLASLALLAVRRRREA